MKFLISTMHFLYHDETEWSWLSFISIEDLTLVYIKISAARKRDGDWSFCRPASFQVTRFAGVYGGCVLLKISCSSCPVRARKIVLPGFLGQPSCLQRLSVDPRTGYWPSLGGAVEMREMLKRGRVVTMSETEMVYFVIRVTAGGCFFQIILFLGNLSF